MVCVSAAFFLEATHRRSRVGFPMTDVTPSWACRHATRQSLARWTKRSTPASTCRLPGAVYTLFFPCRGVLAISSIGNRWIPLCFSWIRRLYPCHLVLFSESEPKAVQHPLD